MNEHAPGWYEHEGERRYWDGSQWTHSSSTPAASTPPPPLATPPPTPPVTSQVVPYAPPPMYGSGQPPYPGGIPVARKEPAIALVVSFLIPGVGSMMNGDVGAGVGFLGLYIFGLVLVICLGWILIGFIGLPIMLVAWGWSMYHAYQGAVDFNRRAGYQN
ncbi:hypothetical protein [Janibacter limosus]|uniref:hypothetical protein n=1 Tax=Janibacter limosus TaxID=53458 RepID=UPI000A7BFD9F|nr:hypothetical protein [Janibacter limosus]